MKVLDFKVPFPKESLCCFLNFQLPNAIFRCFLFHLESRGSQKRSASDPRELADDRFFCRAIEAADTRGVVWTLRCDWN